MEPFLLKVFISLEENTEHTLKEFLQTVISEMQLVYLKAGPPFRGTETTWRIGPRRTSQNSTITNVKFHTWPGAAPCTSAGWGLGGAAAGETAWAGQWPSPLPSTPYTRSKTLHLISKPQLKQNKIPPAHKHQPTKPKPKSNKQKESQCFHWMQGFLSFYQYHIHSRILDSEILQLAILPPPSIRSYYFPFLQLTFAMTSHIYFSMYLSVLVSLYLLHTLFPQHQNLVK